MSKNMTRKGLAFGAGFALVASGLAAMPAQAAPGDFVTLKPSVGSNLGVFVNDDFIMNATYSSQINPATAAFRFDDADQGMWQFTIQTTNDASSAPTGDPDELDIAGITPQGEYKAIAADLDLDSSGDDGTFVVDMDTAGVASLVFFNIQGVTTNTEQISLAAKPLASTDADNSDLVREVQTSTSSGDTPASDDVYRLTIPGFDPVEVTAGSGADKTAVAALLDTALDDAGIDVDVAIASSEYELTYATSFGNPVLATLTNTTESPPTEITFAETTPGTSGAYDSDTDVALGYNAEDVSATVTAWVESEAVADYSTVDSTYASEARTVTWYDPKNVVVIPRIERVNGNLNDDGNALHGSIEFNKPINYEMFDKGAWTPEVTTGSTLPDLDTNTTLSNTDVLPTGLKNADQVGRWIFNTGATVDKANTYTLSVHSDLTETATVERWFPSTGYSISTGNTVGTLQAEVDTTDTEDVIFTTGSGDVNANAEIRAGVNSVTYTAQLQSDASTDEKRASVPMLAIVEAGSFLPEDTSLTVAGNPSPITLAKEQRIVNGFSNSDGKFSVTVNSAEAAKDETYTVKFFVLNDGVFTNDSYQDRKAQVLASYSVSGSTISLEPVNSVVSGEEVTVAFDIEDQFGQPISETAKGKQLNVSLVAPNTDDLELTSEVVDGEVSFTFDNYLTVGSSDLLTATLYTGTASDPSDEDTKTITLYNTGATGAIQVPEELTGEITFDDFIPNGEKVTAGVNIDPSQDIAFTGTVVDENGVGIPAAPVTINAPGMQIQDGDRYYIDQRTVTANSAGVFSVDLNAHVVNTDGAEVTVTTADGTTATTLVKTYLPEDENGSRAGSDTLTGNNLNMTVDMPDTIVMNKTYAVTAKLTDKWGNPVKTAGSAVEFLGSGSININGSNVAIEKDFDKNGEALVYVRSVKDIAGPGTLDIELKSTAKYTAWNGTETADTALQFGKQLSTDNPITDWDETLFESTFSEVVEVYETAADAPAATSDQKVNAGSFKGFVALYAKGYEGQRMSAIVAGKWLQVDSLASDFERVVRFTGAGYDIKVRIYIDGEQVGPEFDILTK